MDHFHRLVTTGCGEYLHDEKAEQECEFFQGLRGFVWVEDGISG